MSFLQPAGPNSPYALSFRGACATRNLLFFVLCATSLFAQNLKLEKTIGLPENTAALFTAMSLKGDYLAAACKDSRVRLWTYPGMELKQSFDLKDQPIAGMRFSDDGSLLTVTGERGLVRIWAVPSGKLKLEFSLGTSIVALAMSPDHGMLALAPAEKPAQLFDLTLGKLASDLPAKFAGATALDFSPDGNWLAAAGADTGVRFYEGQTGAPRAVNEELLLEPFAVAFSSDSKTLYVGGADKTISAIDVVSGKIVRAFPKQKFVVSALLTSRDGKTLAATYFDENSFNNPAPFLVWDVSAGTVRTTIMQPGFSVIGMRFLADGRLLVTSNAGGKLQVWSVK